MPHPWNNGAILRGEFHGPTKSDVIFFAEQEAKRATIFRDKNGNALVAFYHNLVQLKEYGHGSTYRSACINLLIAELESFLEDPTMPKMHIFQDCALQAFVDISKIREHGVKAQDEPAMGLIEQRIEKVSTAIRLVRNLYTAYELRKTDEVEKQFGKGANAGSTYPLHSVSDNQLSPYDRPASFTNVAYLRARSPSNPKKESPLWIQPQVPTRIPKPGVPQVALQIYDDSPPETPDEIETPGEAETPSNFVHYRKSSAFNLHNSTGSGMRRTVSSIITPGLGLGLTMHVRNSSNLSMTSVLGIPKTHNRSNTNSNSPITTFDHESLQPSRVGTPDDFSSGLTASWGLKEPRRSASAGGFHARTGSYLGAIGEERILRPPSRMGTPFSNFFVSTSKDSDGEVFCDSPTILDEQAAISRT